MTPILVTGAAGFIGFHVAARLLALGHEVTGIDNLNDYYDPTLKASRLEVLRRDPRFRFHQMDVADREAVAKLFAEEAFERVVHLAAQAGVRYSLNHPFAYVDSNIVGFLTILEGCRHHGIQHLVFASSSSIYGDNIKQPSSEDDITDHQVSLYGATKKANEVMAYAYSNLYGIPTTGLRFFTVYGPWGRPDMAYFSFTRAILEGRTIDVYNHGQMRRDFTYIDDIVDGIVRVLDRTPAGGEAAREGTAGAGRKTTPYRIYNIGNHRPVELLRMIELLESHLGRTATKRFMEHQPGDVFETYADIEHLRADAGFEPSTELETGLKRFVEWYTEYYGVPLATQGARSEALPGA